MHRLYFAMSLLFVIGPMSVLAEAVGPQEATDQIQRKAKELSDIGCHAWINSFGSPGLSVHLISPKADFAKAIDLLEGFPHPLLIGLAPAENAPKAQELSVDFTKLCDLRVEQLAITSVSLNPSQVQCIGRMKSLIKLRVQNCPGFDNDGLRSLTKLEKLELFDTDVTDAGLEPVIKLKWLDIESARVTGVGLSKLEELHYLSLKNSAISNDGLGVIGSLPELGYLALTLGEHADTEGLIRLSRAPRLKSLTFLELSARTKIVGKELRVPNQFPQLSSLYINSTTSSKNVCELISGLSGAGTKSLQLLVLNCRDLDDELFDHLREYSRIPQSVNLSPCRVTDAGAIQFTSNFQCSIKMSSYEFVNGTKRRQFNPYEAELREKEAQLEKLRKAGRSSPGLQYEVELLRRGERSGK